MKLRKSLPSSAALCVIVAANLAPSFTNSLSADDWTRFRGPNGSGVSDAKHIPVEITAADINWTTILGIGHSSPVVVGDKIFLTAEDSEKNTRSLLCLSVKSGKKLWEKSKDFEKHSSHRYNNFASATPAADADRVYVSWTTGETHEVRAFSHAGEEVWTKVLGHFSEPHGSSSSPIIAGNMLLVGNDHALDGSYLAGLSKADGEMKWQIKRNTIKGSFSTPTLFTPKNDKPQAIYSSNPKTLTAVDPETGKILWEYSDAFGKAIRTVASPVVVGDFIFASAGQGSGGRGSVIIKPPGKNGKPEEAWEMTNGLPYVPTPVAYKGLLFVLADSGTMTCVNAKTGEEAWKERVAGETYSSPICIDGKIYCFSRRGEMAVVAAKDAFEPLGKHNFQSDVHATPAVAGGRLYVRTEKKLISIGGEPEEEPAGE
jgi:outer membrane protein assembly factor BamB